ncbi:MAG: glycosyltransferase [Candidatus Rokubacteria bacterium]|nr:glycosyltransferase [Candidatus Rokubacteria bacterium]
MEYGLENNQTMKRNPIYYWIDHTAKYASNTGMQRVTRCLARALMNNDKNVVFVGWNSERKSLVLVTRDELEHFSRFSGPQLDRTSLAQYPAVGEVCELHEAPHFVAGEGWLIVPEVTHITYHESPPTLDPILYARHYGLRSAFIFYDAIPLKLPEYATAAEAHAAYMQHIAMADLIIPISEFSADDYVAYLRTFICFDDRTLPTVRPVSLPGEIPESPRAQRLEQDSAETMILSVGTVEPHKNQITLIDAFNRLCVKYPERSLRLVLVGHLHPAVAERVLEATQRNPKISYLQYVEDVELVKLYRRSKFTVFPSIEEGFGLPILESLWHGKPCVCAKFGAMDEVAREGGCLQVDVRSVDQIATAMERLATDENQWRDLAQEALTRKIKTWDAYATEISLLLDEISDPVSKVRRILYWVEHTCIFPYNTGIQRVTRLLAKSLIAEGVELVPVKWDAQKSVFVPPTHADLEYLARWSGPDPNAWTLSDDFADKPSTWLLIPELTAYPSGPDLPCVVQYAASLGIRSSILFYDAIPYKMPECCSPLATTLHTAYMGALDRFHLVIAISEHSRMDLRDFLVREKTRLIDLDDRVIAISLPGEFIDVPRTTRYEEPSGDVISILSVGTIEKRKNHAKMFRAFLAAMEHSTRKAELTVVGRVADDLREEVEGYISLNPAIKWIGHVDDARLRELYSACHFTVYPSLEEGFGLPILESLWHGKPCICRDRGAMVEAAQGGGCILVDTADEAQLAEAIRKLIDDEVERERLGREATSRTFKTWRAYSREVLAVLADRSVAPFQPNPAMPLAPKLYSPLLSICITTYNRSEWLDVSLKQLTKFVSPYTDVVEIVVCDNASSDNTERVAAQYRGFPGFRYFRNPVNVGMLGNLRETVHHARGRFVWLLGDDDILQAGALEKILGVIVERPNLALIYLNYAYTHHDAPRTIEDIDEFVSSAIPITPLSEDRCAPIAELATMSENFFTAIYCLVFRRDHAIKAYSQDIVGQPFSSLLTCIPTSYYVCNYMFREMGYWIGEPCVVVNMNVSWVKHAPLWVLERLPELYELAELRGADPAEVDRWRVHNLPGALHFLPVIYFDDGAGNRDRFSFERFVRRHKHLAEFQAQLGEFVKIYQRAYDEGLVRNDAPPTELLTRFGLVEKGY